MSSRCSFFRGGLATALSALDAPPISEMHSAEGLKGAIDQAGSLLG